MPIDMGEITLETFELAKATTSGISTSTGIYGYDLSGWVSLVPVLSPFRNGVARKKSPNGNTFNIWRAFLNVNNQQPNAAISRDFAGNLVKVDEQDMVSPYAVLALAGSVTQDSVDTALGLGVDPNALERITVMNQLLISEDILGLGGCAFALNTPVQATPTTATTGGTIALSTAIHVKVAARTLENYYYGGSTVASADATVTTGSGTSTNTVTATVTSGRKGAVAFDWFVGPTSGSYFYYTTTVVPTLTITFLPTANQPIPTALPLLSSTAPTAPPTADSSADPNSFNGLLYTIVGDYVAGAGGGQLVTPGSGQSWGAAYNDMAGSQLTLNGGTISQVDAMFLSIWNNVLLSPSRILCNALEAQDMSHAILSQPSAVTYLGIDSQADTDRLSITAGGFVGHMVNTAAGGVPVRIEVQPHIPPGTMIFVTDTVPFPGANIDSTLIFRTLRDYASYDYASNRIANTAGGGPRQDFEIRTFETLENFAPTTMGVISGIQSSSNPLA